MTVPVAPVDRATYRRLAGRAKLLSWASLAYMAVEGGVAILAGILAGSIARIGFGLDSVIEGVASLVIVWRFTGTRMFSEAAEPSCRTWESPSSASPSRSARRRRGAKAARTSSARTWPERC